MCRQNSTAKTYCETLISPFVHCIISIIVHQIPVRHFPVLQIQVSSKYNGLPGCQLLWAAIISTIVVTSIVMERLLYESCRHWACLRVDRWRRGQAVTSSSPMTWTSRATRAPAQTTWPATWSPLRSSGQCLATTRYSFLSNPHRVGYSSLH